MAGDEWMQECPMRAIAGLRDTSCPGGRCAWWANATTDQYGMCAVRLVAARLGNIGHFQRVMSGRED